MGTKSENVERTGCRKQARDRWGWDKRVLMQLSAAKVMKLYEVS